MSKIKHVLVILLLILPMFVLAPTLVAGPNEALTSTTKADTALPSALVGETLRVAVYAETNTTLPSYASGGVSTAHYANLIQFLDANGYAVTAISTQDILDHKLMAASFDVFIIPNNLPKDDIVNPVIDYWLAGGGILSFDIGVGFLYYHGMIVSAESGSFGLLNVDVEEHWGYDIVGNFTIGERHSTAIDYEADDVIQIGENTTIHDRDHFANANPADFVHLLVDSDDNDNTCGFALDNTERQGGRIVQLPGNCSTIPVWERSIITDSIDWLAPKPKARVAFDFTHKPYYGVDTWDENVSFVPRYNIWRDFLVDHSFTADKLYPTGSNLTAVDIAPFDVLIVAAPNLNYSAGEISLIRNWAEDGNGLFYLGDWNGINDPGQTKFNELMEPWGLGMDLDGTNAGTFIATEFTDHPTLEYVNDVQITGGDFLTVSGNAYPIVNQSTDVIIGGSEPGLGRVIACGDINIFDYNHIGDEDNTVFAINIIDWLGSANADILIYTDEPFVHRLNSPVAKAANELGLKYMITGYDLNLVHYLDEYVYDLLVIDSPWNDWSPGAIDEITEHIESGRRFIASFYYAHNDPTNALWPLLGFEPLSAVPNQADMYIWNAGHPIFNLPNDYAADRFESTEDYGTEGTLLHVYANATSLGGMTATAEANQSTVVLGNNGRTLFNAYLIDQFQGDYDNSTYVDNIELWMNELGFMYYDRPIVNNPDDVTYMATETGNEITWIPVADAGPWEYVVRENGTIVESGHWNGGAITINVDGVNSSLTDYQLTVFDTLGYSASDVVVLNVTAYVGPTTTGGGTPVDPTLLLIVGAVLVVVIIIVIVMKKKK